MKTKKKVILIVLCLLVCSGVAYLIYAVPEAKDIVVNKVVPIVVGIFTGCGAIYLPLAPAISTLVSSAKNFKNSTDTNILLSERFEALQEENTKLKETISQMNTQVSDLKTTFSNFLGIFKKVVLNTKELVENGSASEIAKELKNENTKETNE